MLKNCSKCNPWIAAESKICPWWHLLLTFLFRNLFMGPIATTELFKSIDGLLEPSIIFPRDEKNVISIWKETNMIKILSNCGFFTLNYLLPNHMWLKRFSVHLHYFATICGCLRVSVTTSVLVGKSCMCFMYQTSCWGDVSVYFLVFHPVQIETDWML